MTHATATYDAALSFLRGRINYERAEPLPYRARDFKLDRMRELLALIGDPQSRYPILHLAGTKGKGSTAHMLASILTAAGLRTGLYTSPHLERIEERLAVDGDICSEAEFTALVTGLRPAIERLDAMAAGGERFEQGPTFFEITTAMAWQHFFQRGVDAAVIEVGLGGRLDSTNVCRPVASVITSISFDHTEHLGYTLREIAAEKAGIIKPGVPVISGVIDAEPRAVIEQVAREHGGRLYVSGEDFSCCDAEELASKVDGDLAPANSLSTHRPSSGPDDQSHFPRRLVYREAAGERVCELKNLQLRLFGRHQIANAGLAISTVMRLREFGWKIPDEAIRAGLGRVRCPARIEWVRSRPIVLLDTAHNVVSAQALADSLEESFAGVRQKLLIFAVSQDKDAAGMLKDLLPRFDRVIFTRFQHNPRARAPSELAELAGRVLAERGRATCVLETAEQPADAWRRAVQIAAANDLICITGSFFLAAELRPLLAAEGS